MRIAIASASLRCDGASTNVTSVRAFQCAAIVWAMITVLARRRVLILRINTALLLAALIGPFLAEATFRVGIAVGIEALRTPGLGTLVEGAPADLLVFRQDPTRDLAALASLETVVADGRAYSKAALDAAVQRHLEYAEAWLPRTLARLETELVLYLLSD